MAGLTYYRRDLEPLLRQASREFPALVLTGPRQSGKTTLLRHLFGRSHEYLSLDAPDTRGLAASDPRGFLELHSGPLILDEIQHAPELLSYLKGRIDDNRHRKGHFLLTGSQNLLLAGQIAETLAGRAGMFQLLPMSRREMAGRRDMSPLWRRPRRWPTAEVVHGPALWNGLVRGSFPELVAEPGRNAGTWIASYIQTYLERDVRSLRQVGSLLEFQSFVRMLAARSGQLLNLADISRDIGVALNTAKAWLGILEATYQVIVVRPYFENIGKRLVKTPKVYFTDTGVLCYLTAVRTADHAAAGPMTGAIVETAVLSEIVKTHLNHGRAPRVHFWRTSTGSEVDFLIEGDHDIVPIEVKASSTVKPAMAAGIHALRRDLGARLGHGFVIHTGATVAPMGEGVTAVPFGLL